MESSSTVWARRFGAILLLALGLLAAGLRIWPDRGENPYPYILIAVAGLLVLLSLAARWPWGRTLATCFAAAMLAWTFFQGRHIAYNWPERYEGPPFETLACLGRYLEDYLLDNLLWAGAIALLWGRGMRAHFDGVHAWDWLLRPPAPRLVWWQARGLLVLLAVTLALMVTPQWYLSDQYGWYVAPPVILAATGLALQRAWAVALSLAAGMALLALGAHEALEYRDLPVRHELWSGTVWLELGLGLLLLTALATVVFALLSVQDLLRGRGRYRRLVWLAALPALLLPPGIAWRHHQAVTDRRMIVWREAARGADHLVADIGPRIHSSRHLDGFTVHGRQEMEELLSLLEARHMEFHDEPFLPPRRFCLHVRQGSVDRLVICRFCCHFLWEAGGLFGSVDLTGPSRTALQGWLEARGFQWSD